MRTTQTIPYLIFSRLLKCGTITIYAPSIYTQYDRVGSEVCPLLEDKAEKVYKAQVWTRGKCSVEHN